MSHSTSIPPQSPSPEIRIDELCRRFIADYALPRYRDRQGQPSAEVHCFNSAIRLLIMHFGELSVDRFRALALRTLREKMVTAGWSRKWINKQIGRVRRMFRIGASWEMVDPDVLASLETVPPLSVGETSAPETEPRLAVSEDDLAAVREVMPQLHRDIFDLLLLCGARPGELLLLTPGMIDRNGEIWRCDLRHHKTAKRGKTRTLFFIPKAQAILRRYLTLDPDKRLFSLNRNSFSTALKRHCERAGVPHFVPHQLRHTVATKLADDLGIESAQRLLGHSTAAMTAHYSRAAEKKAIAAVKRLG